MSIKMDKEDIESAINKIVRESEDFMESPTYLKALELDKDISILRYMVGEQNFMALHYFMMVHEKAIRLIDKHDKAGKDR